jgi:hypothetical protein
LKYLTFSRVSDPDPDPDPYWIRIQSNHWIRIRIRNFNTDPDPDPRSKFCFVSSQKSFTLTQSTKQTTFQVGVFLWGMNVGLVI